MSNFSPSEILAQLPTYVDIRDTGDGSRRPFEAAVYDDIAVYYKGRHKTRKKALDAVEKAILEVTKAKGA